MGAHCEMLVLQYFTKPDEQRLETLPNTVGPKMDIVDRFMTAHGELVKVVLWDTGKPFLWSQTILGSDVFY